jgi:hypothetical protein
LCVARVRVCIALLHVHMYRLIAPITSIDRAFSREIDLVKQIKIFTRTNPAEYQGTIDVIEGELWYRRAHIGNTVEEQKLEVHGRASFINSQLPLKWLANAEDTGHASRYQITALEHSQPTDNRSRALSAHKC